MMPASNNNSNKNKNKKKMQWPAVIRRPASILLSKQEFSTSKGGSKFDNSSIPSKAKVSPSTFGTKSVAVDNTREIPHSVVVVTSKSAASKSKTQAKEGSDHATAVRNRAVSAPSAVHHRAYSPHTGAEPTFDSKQAVSRGKRLPSDAHAGLSSGGPFRLESVLRERTNDGLDRKARTSRQHTRREEDVLLSSDKSVPAKAKSKRLGSAKDRPQDRPGTQLSPPLQTFQSYGMKVTMIDANLMIFTIDLVPPEICDVILSCMHRHVRYMEAMGNADKCWRALYTYTKMDIPCAEVPGIAAIMERIMKNVVYIIGHMYGRPHEASCLRPRSWKEPHLLMYQKVKGRTPHTGVEMHYDGCHMTTQIMLSDRSEYQGGGTYFRALRKTVKLRKGQILVHPGELYHKGVDITEGVRKMIVCFMDGFDPGISDYSSEREDRKEYEANILRP